MHTSRPSLTAVNMQAPDFRSAIIGLGLLKSALILAPLILLPFMTVHAQEQRTYPDPASVQTTQAPNAFALTREFGKLPLSFEVNQGQSDPQVRFLSHGSGYSLFLTDREAVLALRKPANNEHALNSHSIPAKRATLSSESTKTDVVRMQLIGASPDLHVSGIEQLPGKTNYFVGNNPAQWHSNVATFSKVKYAGVYPDVDLIYYGNQQQLEFDFVVAPLADTGQIRLRFEGAEKLTLEANGDLDVIARNGRITFHKPVFYQINDGARLPVSGQFALLTKNTIGFTLGRYDSALPLVIDPVLAYSTYLGGTQNNYYGDQAAAIAVDSSGNAYIAGLASSNNFPTTPTSYQPQKKSTTYGAFITELDSTGSKLIYSTFIGGTTGSGDQANAIALDKDGNVYITGSTQSPDFPVTPGAPQSQNNTVLNDHQTGFVTKLNAGGASLGFSTYLGGSTQGDTGYGIAVDSEGSAYVTGIAVSTDFPVTSGTYQSTSSPRGTPLFVTKYNPKESHVVYSALLFGNNTSQGNAIAVDGSGNAYVTGYSVASNYPTTTGAFETGNPIYPTAPYSEGKCGIVTKLSPDASALLYSTYVCGLGTGSQGNGLAIDSEGSAYITGFTDVDSAPGDAFPTTPGAYKTKPDGDNENLVFLTKMKPDGSGLAYSTYIGPGNGNAIALDSSGNAAIAGVTNASSFPQTADAIQPGVTLANNNAFVSKLSSDGSRLVYSTLMGTNDIDQANGIAVDSTGDAYVAGYTTSSGFPTTTGALLPSDPQPGNGYVGFVSKLSLGSYGAIVATTTTLTSPVNPQKVGAAATFAAYVKSGAGTVIPSGTVSFSVDGGAAVDEALDDTGHASFSTSELKAGVHQVVASYLGDTNHLPSKSPIWTETIYGAATIVAPSSGSGQHGTYGTPLPVQLSVLVKDAEGDGVPGIVVTFAGTGFKFSSTTAATASDGIASVTATPVAIGSLTITGKAAGIAVLATFSEDVVAATLRVAATDIKVSYGQAIPPLTYTITGFVNGDTRSVVTGAPTESTTATKGSEPAVYPIIVDVGSLKAKNYSFTALDGTVTIASLGPTAEPAASQVITIAEATSGAVVYYTTNGSTPTTASTRYTGPITITKSETLKFIAVAPGHAPSSVRTVTDTVQ